METQHTTPYSKISTQKEVYSKPFSLKKKQKSERSQKSPSASQATRKIRTNQTKLSEENK
jgi:hypothetical protein